MRGLSALLFAALAAAAPAAARAGVVVGEGVPFTEGELSAALAARDDGAPDEILVEVPPGPASSGRGPGAADRGPAADRGTAAAAVLVTTPSGTWTIALGDARGPSAARLVALHLIDASDGATPVAPPPALAPSRVAAAPLETPPTDDLDDPPAVAAVAPSKPVRRITFAAGIGRGTGDVDLPAATWSAELTVAKGRWVGGGAFWLQVAGPSEPRDVGERVMTAMGQLRALFGVRQGSFELVGGPHAGMMFFDEVPGSRARMMVGVGGAARYRIPLRPRGWSLQLSAGADGYRHRVVVEASGTPLASSPRVAYLFNVGLSGVLGR